MENGKASERFSYSQENVKKQLLDADHSSTDGKFQRMRSGNLIEQANMLCWNIYLGPIRERKYIREKANELKSTAV